MEIGSSTSSYISSISVAYKQTYGKANKVDPQIKISTGTSISLNKSSDDSDSILNYYHDLCKKYPNISFRLEDMEISLKNTNNPPNLGYNNSFNQVGNNFGSLGQCSIIIDKKVIENMQKDTVYKEIVYSYIENLERQQVGYQQHAAQEGMSCFAHVLEDNNGELAPSTLYGHGSFSTEEEVKRMWADYEYQKKAGQALEQQKADLIEIYLKMTENCAVKRDELNPSKEGQQREIHFEKGTGYIHWAITDIEMQVYKSVGDDGEYLYRVDTSKDGEITNSRIIDPKRVNPRNASSEELLALDEYLSDTNQLPKDTCIRDLAIMSEYSSDKFDALKLGEDIMQVQYDFGNYPSYLKYNGMLDVLKQIAINFMNS